MPTGLASHIDSMRLGSSYDPSIKTNSPISSCASTPKRRRSQSPDGEEGEEGWSSDEDGSYSSMESNPELDNLVAALKLKDHWKFASTFPGAKIG
eukprot:5516999-Pyramimonas_sp.AAC.1